jgi:hypothetical protein
MKLSMLFLLLATTVAHADDFGDRAHQSFAQERAAREAATQRQVDRDNVRFIQRMLQVEKANGGANTSGKCFDTTYDFKHSWIPVPWQSGGYSMPIYSRRTLEGQRRAIGEAFNGIMACTFNTQNGYACEVQESTDSDTNKTEYYVTCYDKVSKQFTANSAGRLVKYVAPPPTEPTPISQCARDELDYMQRVQSCNQIQDSNDRQTCMNAVGNDPGGCNR